MQATSINFLASSPFVPFSSTKTITSNTLFRTCQKRVQTSPSASIAMKAAKSSSSDAAEVDYSSMATSVFPAEACDTLGGVACDVEMFPETKLKREEPKKAAATPSQTIDREYLRYDSPKTVFIAEACDDLGGEFCEPTYQSGAN